MTKAETGERILISEANDGSRQVVLRPDNNDVFVRTGKQVIAACSLGISLDLWIDEIASLIKFVKSWTEAQSVAIDSCFIEPRPRCVMLFFATKSTRFDFDLAAKLVELTTDLIKQFNVGMVESHQVPIGELEQFLNPSMAKQIYGKRSDQPESSEAHFSVEA